MTNKVEIKTERLLLRSIKLNDAEAIFKYRSDEVSNQFQGWIPSTIEDVNDFIKNRIAKAINIADSWYQLAIIKKDSGELIGDVGIHFIGSDNNQAELGCTLDKKYFGFGYATESLKEATNYLFYELNKHRIVTSIDPKNIKSIKLVERLGFRKEAHFKESILTDGVWVDDLVYAILKDEWINK